MMGEDNLGVDTPLFQDLQICTKYLHCHHKEFLDLPRIERAKLRIFYQVEFKKEQESTSKIREEQLIQNAPKVG